MNLRRLGGFPGLLGLGNRAKILVPPQQNFWRIARNCVVPGFTRFARARGSGFSHLHYRCYREPSADPGSLGLQASPVGDGSLHYFLVHHMQSFVWSFFKDSAWLRITLYL